MAHDSTPLPAQLIDEVSEWFIAMRDPSVTAEMRAAFAQWLSASPQHVRAYLEMAALWGEAARLPEDLSTDVGSESEPSNVVHLHTAAQPAEQRASASRSASIRMGIAAAAAACLALLAAGWWFLQGDTLSTDVGEQRLVTLEDGSTVRLNARSKVYVRMSTKRRELDLLAGQALFEVAKDAQRPFTVRAGGTAVRAVGTAFDINRRARGTVITVLEGRVTLATRNAGAAPSATQSQVPLVADIAIGAGEQAVVDRAGAVEVDSAANLSAATSWIHNLLVFEGTPLDTVIEEFNRYSRRPMVLEEETLATLRINAVLQSGNPDALLRYLERHEDVRVSVTPAAVRISRPQVPTSPATTLLPSEH